MKKRGNWSSRYAFYMAAVGSAFALGNLWRFPYVVGMNGGGAFVLLYFFYALVIGLPVLISELMLGKSTRLSAVGAIEGTLHPKPSRVFGEAIEKAPKKTRWRAFGYLSIIASLLLLSYYAVVSGWVLHFVVQYTVGLFQSTPLRAGKIFDHLMDAGPLQVALASVHILITCVVVARGLKEGIEKWMRVLVPLFLLLIVFLMVKSLSLPGAIEGLRFFLYPDFSKLTPSTLVEVIGHVFFTLSLGMGAMVAFGSYLSEETHIPTEGFRVAALDTIISLLAGIVIFPIVFSGNLEGAEGPSLLFLTIPLLLNRIGLGVVFGLAFFVCLYSSALAASIGLLESGVANLIDRRGYSRKQATLMVGTAAFMLAVVPALSSSLLRDVSIHGLSLLSALDALLIRWVLPVSALGLSIIVGYKMPVAVRESHFVDPKIQASVKLYGAWIFVLRWAVPVIILGAILIELVGYWL